MKNLFVPVLAVVALAAFLACDKNATEGGLTEGDYNSIEFTLAKQDADSTVIELNGDDSEAGDWLNWGQGSGLAKPTADSVGYDSTTGWHFFIHSYTDQYVEISVADSIRFTDADSSYQFHPDSTTNMLERRLKKLFSMTPPPEMPGTAWVKSRQRNANWVGLADTVTTLNADFQRHWQGQDQYRNFTRQVDGVLSDVKFYTEDLKDGRPTHPFDGILTAQMSLDVERPDRMVHLQGTLTVTFYPDHYHARLERGSNWWEWDHYYGP